MNLRNETTAVAVMALAMSAAATVTVSDVAFTLTPLAFVLILR